MSAAAERDRSLARPKLQVYGFGIGMVRPDLVLARSQPITTGTMLMPLVVAGYRHLDW